MQRRRLFTAAGLGLAAASRPASAMIWNTKRVTPLEERVKPLVVRYLMSPGWSEEAPLMKLLIEGLERARKQYRISYECREMRSRDLIYEDMGRVLEECHPDMVICLGSEFTVPLVFHARRYPNVKFGIMGVPLVNIYPNIMSVMFSPIESGFICGALAALALNRDVFSREGSAVGWISGGDDAEADETFLGFRLGAHFIREDLVIHRDSIDSYTDQAAAREVALDFYASGCAITFAHVGEAGLGALEAAELADKFAIGIDSDQDALYPGHIITSLLKHYDRAAFSFIEAAVKGRFHGLYLMNLSNYGIEFTEMKVLKEYLGAYTVNALFNELHILRRSLVQRAISIPYPGYYTEALNYE